MDLGGFGLPSAFLRRTVQGRMSGYDEKEES